MRALIKMLVAVAVVALSNNAALAVIDKTTTDVAPLVKRELEQIWWLCVRKAASDARHACRRPTGYSGLSALSR